MSFNATIIDVRKEQGTSAKGPYTYTLLEYDYQGETRSSKIFDSAFKKYVGLKESLASLKRGDNVNIDTSQNGQYKEVSSVSIVAQAHPLPKGSTTTKVATGATKPTGYDNLGQQIGNSITNAVNSLGIGKATEDYKTRAIEFIAMGDQIRDLVNSGSLEKMLAQDEQDHSAYADASPDEDIPF